MPRTANTVDDLMLKVLKFIDRNGSIISKDSNPMSSSLAMVHKAGDFTFNMSVYSHGQGNGSCSVTVKRDRKLIFKAVGGYTGGPNNCKIECDDSREWEKAV